MLAAVRPLFYFHICYFCRLPADCLLLSSSHDCVVLRCHRLVSPLGLHVALRLHCWAHCWAQLRQVWLAVMCCGAMLFNAVQKWQDSFDSWVSSTSGRTCVCT